MPGLALAVAIAGAALSTGCTPDMSPPPEDVDFLSAPAVVAAAEPITPLPAILEHDERKARLGERLFKDPRLSGDGTVACSSCHFDDRALTDGASVARLPTRPIGTMNVPTLWNVALGYRYNWQAKFGSLEEHHDALIRNPSAMAASWAQITSALSSEEAYRSEFAALYPAGLVAESIRDALIQFERSLVSSGGRFDRYLQGDVTALDAEEVAGYGLFRSHGCISCHNGVLIGANMVQKLGVMRDYFGESGMRDDPTAAGRFAITGDERDRHVFRVPSLRNVARTGPYLHDGSIPTLEGVIDVMARHQLGRSLDAAQTHRIAAFLRALDGELPGPPAGGT